MVPGTAHSMYRVRTRRVAAIAVIRFGSAFSVRQGECRHRERDNRLAQTRPSRLPGKKFPGFRGGARLATELRSFCGRSGEGANSWLPTCGPLFDPVRPIMVLS